MEWSEGGGGLKVNTSNIYKLLHLTSLWKGLLKINGDSHIIS